MKFDWRKHIDVYKEVDDDLKLNHKMFSMASLNAFVEHNSSPRGLMMSSHIAQLVVLNEPEENMIQTGLEKELGKYTISKIVDEDSEVLSVIKRYNTLGDINKVSEYLVITRSLETGVIDAIKIPYYNAYHPYFGFSYNKNEDLDSLIRGDVLPKDTVLASPPTNLENGGYGFGKDINVANMVLPEDDEDGFIVSESFCKKFKFKIFDTRTIEVGEDSFLLNIYGDENEYKPFPEIGEYINESGVVAVARKYDPMYAPGLYSKNDLREFNPLFDEAVYTRGKRGKIVDIKVYSSFRRKKALPTGTDKYCFKYSDALLAYYRQIVETYESINRDYNRTFGRDVEVSNNFNMLLVEAYGILDSSSPKSKCKKMYRKETLDLFRVEFVIENELQIGVKNKITDLHGNKGTIVSVWKDEDMPVDEDGNKADIIMDPKSTISRLNVGRLYERHIKAGMVKLVKIVREEFKNFNVSEVYELNNDQLISLFSHAVEFNNVLETKLAKYYEQALHNVDREKMISVVDEILNDKFRTYLTVDNEKRKWEILHDLDNTIYKPVYSNVRFRYKNRDVISKNRVLIAPMYIFLLSKIADTVLACSSAKLNHFGIPVVTSKADRNKLPYKNSPVRTQGETEGRLYVSYGGEKFLAEMKDLNTSIDSHSEAYTNILNAQYPTNIDTIVDRNKIKYGGERGLAILDSLWNSIGMEIKHVKETNPYYDYRGSNDVEVTDIEAVKDIDEVEFDDNEKGENNE